MTLFCSYHMLDSSAVCTEQKHDDIWIWYPEHVVRTMRGHPKRLSRNYLRRNGGNVILYVLILFHSRDVLCSLSCIFVRPCFRLFCTPLAVHYLAFYYVLGNEYNSCVSVYDISLCSFLCRCLLKVTKKQLNKRTPPPRLRGRGALLS